MAVRLDTIHERGYQLEMYEKSMQRNVIVCMATGTGKTQVAKLRIEKELQRTPAKRVWFLAPNVALAEQQYHYLSTHLPLHPMRTLLGHDNVDLWYDQATWNLALRDKHVVISTPQVLLDALRHGFVRLVDVSLLVFDEAHHTQAGSPYAKIMLDHYHEMPSERPHVLGLTASIRISEKTASVSKLESNLDAVCIAPTRSIEEYSTHVHPAEIVEIAFTANPHEESAMVQRLQTAMQSLNLEEDPYFIILNSQKNDPKSAQKLQKILKKGLTPAMEEIKRLLGNAEHLSQNIGPWAADDFIKRCALNWHEGVAAETCILDAVPKRSSRFIDKALAQFLVRHPADALPGPATMSEKARKLVEYLTQQYHQGIAVIVFVERRSTAYALCRLLQSVPELSKYRIFSFVGLATSRSGSLAELADLRGQKACFAEFRRGTQDICVATSVVEEGIDIQAVHLVIRYDDPKEFVSYLQSRGRARQQKSSFVYFRNITDKGAKYAKWKEFEKQLEDDYRREKEEVEAREFTESLALPPREVYTVPATGAKLTYENAVPILQHFCSISTRGRIPFYLLDEQSEFHARAILPVDVPLALQDVSCKHSWPSEKSAKQDAAFEAVKALHLAGILTDNLTPFRVARDMSQSEKQKPSQCDVLPQLDVWHSLKGVPLNQFKLRVRCNDEAWIEMLMFLPCVFDSSLGFDLSQTATRTLRVEVIPCGEHQNDSHSASLFATTQTLFSDVFGKGSAWQSLQDESTIDFLLEFTNRKVSNVWAPMSIESLVNDDVLSNQHALLVWTNRRQRPYMWFNPVSQPGGTVPEQLHLSKVNRLQIYSGLKNLPGSPVAQTSGKTFLRSDCHAKGYSSIYGPIVMLVPTILFVMEAAVRARLARQSIFESIGFSTEEFLVPSLLAKSAFGNMNYERLEFLGDALLKYRASLQMYFEHPLSLEGNLTYHVQMLVSNSRLSKSVAELGLAPYITTKPPVQKHWRLPQHSLNYVELPQRAVSSKTLADTVESVLAAAFLDDKIHTSDDARLSKALRLFFPEHDWRDPVELVQAIKASLQKNVLVSDLSPIQSILGYKFDMPNLLLQAMTHSALTPGVQSYDRLEFLGDAVLDLILKQYLYSSSKLSPESMTILRHALASEAYLNFCALSLGNEHKTSNITMKRDRTLESTEQKSDYRLVSMIQISSFNVRKDIEAAQARYQDQQAVIMKCIENGPFPWTRLRSLDAPKVCSDIIESLLAAIFLDSDGDLAVCEAFLEKIGIMDHLRKMVANPLYEARTPATRLRELCDQKKVGLNIGKPTSDGEHGFTCDVELNSGQRTDEKILTSSPVVGCGDEARSIVAEMALEVVQVGGYGSAAEFHDVSASQDSVMTGADSDDEVNGEGDGGLMLEDDDDSDIAM